MQLSLGEADIRLAVPDAKVSMSGTRLRAQERERYLAPGQDALRDLSLRMDPRCAQYRNAYPCPGRCPPQTLLAPPGPALGVTKRDSLAESSILVESFRLPGGKAICLPTPLPVQRALFPCSRCPSGA